MTKTEIINTALALIGGKSLANADTDTTPQAVSGRKFWELALNEALSAQNWNFATKRTRLKVTRTAITSVTNNGGLVRITKVSHGLVTGDRAAIEKVPCAVGSFFATRIDADTFDLQDSVFASGYSSGGTFLKIPAFGWSYQHALPSDCVKVRRVVDDPDRDMEENDTEPFRVESGFILCDLEAAFVAYTWRNETTSTYPHEFVAALSTLLASYLAQDLAGPAGRSAEIRQTYERLMLPNARGRDAREGKGDTNVNTASSELHASRFA
jgi:hypothetical protein